MKSVITKITTGIATVLFFNTASAQLVVAAATPAQLVDTLLGTGITVSGITYTGAVNARGTFGGVSNIGFPSGVLLTSGNIINAVGPNNTSGASLSNGLVGDPDLDIIMSPTMSFDATILEFDFIPTSDTVKFNYVFASEEYMEFVSTTPGGINDGFGFFISGPGISGPFSGGAENIAIIPGTTLPVTMFNLNLYSYSAYYFDNGDGFGSGTAPDGATIQYDGFTVPLTATAAVLCGQTYHIKLAVGDGGDHVLDSGVFLEEGSFTSQGVQIIPEISYGGPNDSVLYEGCGLACIYFVRSSNLANADTVNLTIAGSAVNGVDYNTGALGVPLPSVLIFAPGQDSISYCINAVPDGVLEGLDTIDLTIFLTGICGGTTTNATVYLNEFDSLSVIMSTDTSICSGSGAATITGLVTGGVAPYTYSWSGGAGSASSVAVTPVATTTYTLTVSDACTNSVDPTPNVSDSVLVTAIPAPVMIINTQVAAVNDSTMFEGCVGSTCFHFIRTSTLTVADTFNITIGGTATNGIDYSVTPGATALPNQIIFPIGVDSVQYCIDAGIDAVEGVETILLSVIQGAVCPQPISFANLYIQDVSPMTIVTSGDTSYCGSGTATISGVITGGVLPYTYSWSGGAGSAATVAVSPGAGNTTYYLTVGDACTNTVDPTPSVMDSVLVTVFPAPVMTISTQIAAVNDSTLFEGCTPACFYFIRTSPLTVADTFNISIGGTATNGTDYSVSPGSLPLPNQIIFPIGVDSVQYCISAGIDGVEGIETIVLNVIQGAVCPQPISIANLYVQDVTPMSIAVSGDTTFCSFGGVAPLGVMVTGGLQPYTYTWSGGLPSTPNPSPTVTTTTTYTVTVADACPTSTPSVTNSVTVTVITFASMVATAGSDMLVCPGDLVALNGQITGGGAPYTFYWTTVSGSDSVSSPGSANTSVVATTPGVYMITIIDTCGNVQTDLVTIDVETSCVLNIPNIITPDGTGPVENEFFYIENLDKFPGSSVAIYDRWGKKIYESADYQNNWTSGKQSDGVYYYVLTVPASGKVMAQAHASSSFKASEQSDNKVFAGYFHITRLK